VRTARAPVDAMMGPGRQAAMIGRLGVNGSGTMPGLRALSAAVIALAVTGLAGCAGEVSSADRAQAQVTAKENALTQAQAEFTEASATFCDASKTYVMALDRYGDVLNTSELTVGDVREAGADLAEPREDAYAGAEAAVEAQQNVVDAEQELADAQAALEQAQSGSTVAPAEPEPEQSSSAPLAPAATVERVKQAEDDFASAQGGITDQTPLVEASEQFNSAAVALELAWLRLFVDAGCLPDEQKQQAEAAVSAYTSTLQQNLADAGYYSGAVDGIYGPLTVAAVEDLQKASGLPVTGTVDRATAAALEAELTALGGAAAQQAVATTAALQQTLKLAGFWDGPVDGVWTPALTEALQAFQTELGVEPTGTVDAATITAFEKALADLKEPATPSETPAVEPTETEEP
jgi:murein L,D-transpeptidase YcbB/YkuD